MGKGRATRKVVDDGPGQRLVDSVDASLEPGPDVFRRLGRHKHEDDGRRECGGMTSDHE